MPSVISAALALRFACVAFAVVAQEAPSQNPAETPPPAASPPAAPATLPVGSPLILEITQALDSRISKRGDKFTLRLAAPIALNGQVIVPAGATGVGQIVDAAPSGAMGRPAKLLLASRYLEFKGAQIPIKGLQLGVTGADKTNTIMAASVVLGVLGLPAMFLHGGEIIIPAGTLGQAKLAAGIDPSGAIVTPAVLTPAILIHPSKEDSP